MSLFNRIKEDRVSARKLRNEIATSVLTTLVGELESASKRSGNDVSDELVIHTCKKFIFNNTETLKNDLDGNVANRLREENKLLEQYLPSQLTADELSAILVALGSTDLGAIMKHLKSNYAGLYDGAVASRLAKEYVTSINA